MTVVRVVTVFLTSIATWNKFGSLIFPWSPVPVSIPSTHLCAELVCLNAPGVVATSFGAQHVADVACALETPREAKPPAASKGFYANLQDGVQA